MPTNPIKKQSILFPNDNEAVAVFPSAASNAEDIVRALDIKPYKAIILVLGGAAGVDEKLIPRLTQLVGRGTARVAAQTNAIIIDGGTQAGVMAMMGEGVAARGYKSMLVGVAPAGKVTYPGNSATGVPLEPNHSHFVLVEGSDWGSETATIYKLITTLTSKGNGAANAGRNPLEQESENVTTKVPAVAILAGGGPISRDEVLRAVRQNLPLIVIEGSGGLADDVAAAWRHRDTLPNDPVMAEIIADGDIHIQRLSNPVKGFERLIIKELRVDKVLMHAWEIFADYDLNANLQQRRFNKLQLSIILLGVVGTALAIVKQLYYPEKPAQPPISWWILYQVLIIVPILLTVLITAANRFKQGTKWLLLRAGAESIKREIYSYRTRAMDYKKEPEQLLSLRVEDITRRTMRTEVNLSGLVPYNRDKGFPPDMLAAGGEDDGFSYLTPDRYIEVRLGSQLNYFRVKSVQIERQLQVLYWLTFIIGGVGTYLAATNQQVWIALTTAIVAAVGTYLGYRQSENTLTKYNQVATDLANVKAWWDALSDQEQALLKNVDSLVEHTEQVLQSEFEGWVQQMQNALAELRKGQEPAPERERNRERHSSDAPKREPAKDQLGTAGEPTKGRANSGGEAVGGQQPTGDARGKNAKQEV
jgi:hypothetical protein